MKTSDAGNSASDVSATRKRGNQRDDAGRDDFRMIEMKI
jgi:hypothetical protein